jgi:hypothetical protein
VWGYPASYLICAIVEAAALPFLLLARRENASSDDTRTGTPAAPGIRSPPPSSADG